VQSEAHLQLIIANFTVHSPFNLLSVHPSSADTLCAAHACLDRQTTGGRGG